MSVKKPTFAQAKLQLQLYDLRREPRLRQARQWVLEKYFPATAEEAQRLAPPGSEENASLRMVMSYWENACQLLRYGLLHEDLFFQTTNEFFLIWDRLGDGAEKSRQQMRNPRLFENMEWAAKRYEKWVKRFAPEFLDVLRGYMGQLRNAARA